MGGHVLGPQALGQQVGQPLRHPPGVDEDQRGAVLAYLGGDPVYHLAELLGRRHRVELGAREPEGQVQRPPVPAVDDGGGPIRVRPRSRAGRPLDGPLGGRQTDALGPGADLEWSSRSRVKARCDPRLSLARAWISSTMTVFTWPRVRRLRPAVANRYRLSGVVTRRAGGRHHGGSGTRRGVSGSDTHGDVGCGQAELGGDGGDLGQRLLQVLWMSTARAFSGET